MPLYEYECRRCGSRFTVLQPIGENEDKVSCPYCESKDVKKVFSPFASFFGGASSDSGSCTSWG